MLIYLGDRSLVRRLVQASGSSLVGDVLKSPQWSLNTRFKPGEMPSGNLVCALFPYSTRFDLRKWVFMENQSPSLRQSWEHLGGYCYFPTQRVCHQVFCLLSTMTGGHILVIDNSTYVRMSFQLGLPRTFWENPSASWSSLEGTYLSVVNLAYMWVPHGKLHRWQIPLASRSVADVFRPDQILGFRAPDCVLQFPLHGLYFSPGRVASRPSAGEEGDDLVAICTSRLPVLMPQAHEVNPAQCLALDF